MNIPTTPAAGARPTPPRTPTPAPRTLLAKALTRPPSERPDPRRRRFSELLEDDPTRPRGAPVAQLLPDRQATAMPQQIAAPRRIEAPSAPAPIAPAIALRVERDRPEEVAVRIDLGQGRLEGVSISVVSSPAGVSADLVPPPGVISGAVSAELRSLSAELRERGLRPRAELDSRRRRQGAPPGGGRPPR